MLAAFSLCFGPACAVDLAAVPASVAQPVQFAAAVSVDYDRGRPLLAWSNTCRVVQASLEEWRGGSVPCSTVTNPTPDGLRRFFAGLPDGMGTAAVQVVYLAARHTRTGAWEFTRQEDGVRAWSELLPAAPLPHTVRVAILDVCHADAVVELPVWRERLAPAPALLASCRDEWTYEFDFFCRQPIDLRGRYPAATNWLRKHLPADWDGHVSNLGVVWTIAYLQTPQPPRTPRDWASFFARCETESRKLQVLCGGHASTVHAWSAE